MGDVLWSPSEERANSSAMANYLNYVRDNYDASVVDYPSLHSWSIANRETFWRDLLDYGGVVYEGPSGSTLVCQDFSSYGWFPKVKLNFAENLLHLGRDGDVALNFVHESGLTKQTTYKGLRTEVAKLQASLDEIISAGDVVAAYMPNLPETVVAMLATSASGGIFTSTSSDFGVTGVVERFSQSNPKVLVAASAYTYNGKVFDQMNKLEKIAEQLPSLQKIILVDFLNEERSALPDKFVWWEDFLFDGATVPTYKSVPFAHPMYIMYSSGTTGAPKCIVHSVGGTLLEHVKELGLHTNLSAEKNILYFTTCGWMMWNWLVSSLFFGAKVTLYEGSPAHPSLDSFIEMLEKEQVNFFGTSPKFLRALEDSGYKNKFALPDLEAILSTGAPLLSDQFDFIYNSIKSDLNISSICGGTDIIGCFMMGNPMLPVRRGEIQSLGLGLDVACYGSEGESVIDREGELVCKQSFPSMPIYFLNDEARKKIDSAYFSKYPEVWHHGDFIKITKDGGVVVYGRSDATLNPGGVRIGTSEIYGQIESIKYIADSLCVGRQVGDDVDVVLFVILAEDEQLDKGRIKEIQETIRSGTSPRHVPKEIYAVNDIPYTRSGKKVELAVARILGGRSVDNLEAIANPESLTEYESYA